MKSLSVSIQLYSIVIKKKIDASIPQILNKYEKKLGSNKTPVPELKPSGKTKQLNKKNETRQFYPQKMCKRGSLDIIKFVMKNEKEIVTFSFLFERLSSHNIFENFIKGFYEIFVLLHFLV